MTEIRIYQSLRKNMLWAILCFVFALGGYFILTDASTSWPTKVLGGGLGIIFFGGGGLFQFTPYTKFSHSQWWKGRSGSDGWAIENQVDAVWGLEFGNRAVEAYFSRTGKNNFSKVEDLI